MPAALKLATEAAGDRGGESDGEQRDGTTTRGSRAPPPTPLPLPRRGVAASSCTRPAGLIEERSVRADGAA